MKLPAIKRFLQEDFPSQTAWIGKLFYPLNLLLNTIYSGFNNGLTFTDNMLCQVKTLAVAGATPTTSFLWSYQTAPIGLFILNVLKSDGTPVTFTVAPHASWSYSAGTINILNVTGLDVSTTYSITFLVVGG